MVLTLINNLGLLVALSVLHGQLMRHSRQDRMRDQLFSGLLFGAVALVGMLTPLRLLDGVIFDGRSIILGVAGLFGGPVAAGIAALMAAAYRIWLGGAGTLMGVCVIGEAALVGVAFHYWRRRHPQCVRMPGLLAFGLLVHVLMLACMVLLPGGIRTEVFRQIVIPVLLIFPAGQLLICLLFLDHEARLQAEEELRLSEQRFRSYVEHAPDAILVADGRRRLVDCNPAGCALLDYSREELLRRTVDDISPAVEEDKLKAAFAALAGAGCYRYEQPLVRRDGRQIQVEVSASRLSPDRFLAIVKDVTERRALEMQLVQARKMESVGRLAGGVAHDFNNMLQAILGHCSMALERAGADATLREDLEGVQQAASRSADLTRQLLTFARKQVIAPRLVDLNAAIPGSLKMLGRLIREDIRLDWRPGWELWRVEIDPSQLDQILANLVVNARDAIAGRGTITLETANLTLAAADADGCPPGEYVVLAVTDTGSGMDVETQQHLFEPFFTSKPSGRGTGLGLATVYGIVKQNRGGISVRSAPGQGSVFRICLPRALAAPEPPVAAAAAVALSGGNETVLVVEDEEAVLKLTRRILARHGYAVLAAASPDAALELAKAHAGPLDLLLTDVVMPGMNGRQLSDRLRQLRPAVKCLYMSGYTDQALDPLGLLDPAVYFLKKPFSSKELCEKVRTALGAPTP
ncbi:MAG: LytS/YhcK type 5TM receptor domain-containing protein [Lentisphaeria bacterium]